MNHLLKILEQKVKSNYTFWDIGLLKTYGAIPGLILGAYFPEFVIKYFWVFAGFFLVLMFRYLYLLWKPIEKTNRSQITIY